MRPILDYAPPTPRGNGASTLIGVAATFAAHCAVQFLLYRGRFVPGYLSSNSDLVVFGLPNLMAITSYAILFRRWVRDKRWSRREKITFAILLTLGLAFLSMWWSILIPMNIYGS